MSINIDKEKHTIERMTELQDKLYAQDTYGVLILFQALDAAGKDGTIKHVMSGINPQGCDVNSFKTPSTEELDHDYLWRSLKVLPERGRIGIFNRSYYEEVLVVRVHSEFLERQKIPEKDRGQHFWEKRFEQINNFEKYLVDTIGGILDKNKITIAAVAFLAGAAALFATIVIFEIDLVKWANCNAPFSPPDDKKSEICRR